jgi:clan AA aspartic protease (TIGR02281 family)
MELFLSLDPANRTTEIDSIISELQRLGRCTPDVPSGNTIIRVRPNEGGVFVLDAVINGVKAVLIYDTGASTVHLTKEYAAKAGIRTSVDNMVMIQGATGATRKDYLAKVARIAVGPVIAHDVTTTVASENISLGNGVDGLLGQTFLSRFKVNFDGPARTMSLGERK